MMRNIRSQLLRGFVFPIAIALLATWPIQMILAIAAQYLSRWFAAGWNRFVSGRFHPLFSLPFSTTVSWRITTLQIGAAIASMFVLWLIALWLYPETDAQPSEP